MLRAKRGNVSLSVFFCRPQPKWRASSWETIWQKKIERRNCLVVWCCSFFLARSILRVRRASLFFISYARRTNCVEIRSALKELEKIIYRWDYDYVDRYVFCWVFLVPFFVTDCLKYILHCARCCFQQCEFYKKRRAHFYKIRRSK